VAKLSFPTTREVHGPLLIDASQLAALDEIIDRHTLVLRDQRDKDVEIATEKEIQRRLARGQITEEQVETQRQRIKQSRLYISSRLERDNRSVALYLRGGREIQAERFTEAINQPMGGEETAIGFALFLAIGSVRATVRVSDRSWRKELGVEVEPNDIEVAQGLFGALNNWATDVEPPKWQQQWLRLKGILAFVLFLWVLMGCFFMPIVAWSRAGERASKIEARKLLADGINEKNQQRAIALLLAIESGYDPGVKTPLLGIRYWSYVIVGMVCLIFAIICPHVCIGVWRGKQKIKMWRSWITAVTVTIPLLLVGGAVLPWVLHWLGLAPPGN
jgi:hypothetical protein